MRHTIDEEAVARGDLSIVMSSFLGVAELPLLPPVRVRLLATGRRASLYIGGFRIRQPKELNMKRLLLVMGMVGCGDGRVWGAATRPISG